jgi:hypothetical protein
VNNPIGVLLRCLACVFYHLDALLDLMVEFPGHDFTIFLILHDCKLLDGLKILVTTDPILEVMAVVTGISQHVGMAQQLVTVLDVLTDLVKRFGEHGNNLMEKGERCWTQKPGNLAMLQGAN